MCSHKPHSCARYYRDHKLRPPETKLPTIFLLLLLLASCAHLLVSGSPPQPQLPVAAGQSKQQVAPPPPITATDRVQTQKTNQTIRTKTSAEVTSSLEQELQQIHLESISDLDHLAYLALRNYNLTDERLLQSSWLVGSSSASAVALQHSRQQHKTPEESDDGSASSSSDLSPSSSSLAAISGGATSAEDSKSRLALMLESLILHLRNGHLRRMSLGELEQVVLALNLSEPFESLRHRRQRVSVLGTNARVTSATAAIEPNLTERAESESPIASDNGDGEHRCLHLVTLYKSELVERLRGGGRGVNGPVAGSQQSRVEYQDQQQPKQEPLVWLEQEERVFEAENGTTSPGAAELSGDIGSTGISESPMPAVDEMRLMGLCKLAINCRSSEDLVDLISKPWRASTSATGANESQSARRIEPRSTAHRRSSNADSLERDTSDQQVTLDELSGRGASRANTPRAKSLRDSLSMSLAKLCPLVLFPLHEDEAQCMVRRDDRPPLVTVWAFATLFVTIVCFCSLIGLSITPLLGSSPADSSGGSSEASGPAGGDGRERLRMNSQSPTYQQQQRRQHKASLTLFEGLAVGSLVGSALFSLIPQAFELQERESNRGFLLKAFIIFSGIYLFFLSERIMRIILDTRQKRKKKKRLNHRSSTTAAVVDLVHHQHSHQTGAHHVLRPVNMQQHSQATTFSTSTTADSQQRHPRPSTSSRGSGSRSRSGGNRLQHAKQQQVTAAAAVATNRQNIGSGNKSQAAQKIRRPAVVVGVAQLPIIQQLAETMHLARQQLRKSTSDAARDHEDQPDHDVRADVRLESPTIRRKRQAAGAKKGQQRKRASRHLHRMPPHAHAQQRRKRTNQQRAEKMKLHKRGRRPPAAAVAARSPESDPDDYYHHDDLSSLSSSSTSSSSSSSSSSSFSSYALRGRRTKEGLDAATRQQTEDSRADYSSSSSSASSVSKCSSCTSFDRDFCGATLNPSDSDDDNDQRRAVSKQMSEISRRHAQKQLEAEAVVAAATVGANSPTRTTFKFDDDDLVATHVGHDVDPVRHMGPIYVNRIRQHGRRAGDRNHQEQDISTVAWMIIIGDGLHNFIDGISIGAAFSESILSGVSISVAVICEEFPHELGDFAVLVSSGMTVRQALGYNFLSACTCYFGMAVGIILGDVNDGASYISALAAGVFLYIALVDMMGELSAALESSSRDSIARTLKLLLLQNVGIAIGISIIFVLSFIDF